MKLLSSLAVISVSIAVSYTHLDVYKRQALDMKTDARLRAALAEVTESASVIIVAQRISCLLYTSMILLLRLLKIKMKLNLSKQLKMRILTR